MSLKSFLLDCVKVLFGIFLGTTIFAKKQVIEIPKIEYVKTIEYDSIYIINDSIEEKIKYIEKQYEQDVETVVSADDSINMCIFTRYVEDYQRTTEDY